MPRVYCLPPIIDRDSEILIMGTLPGTLSIELQRYYANPDNQFWRILGCVFNVPELNDFEYSQKCEYLLKRKIAVWDVLESAEREGVTDNGIVSGTETVNNFNLLFQKYNKIKKVVITGRTAEKYYRQGIRNKKISIHIPYKAVQSSSPTPGRYVLSLVEKCSQWKNELI